MEVATQVQVRTEPVVLEDAVSFLKREHRQIEQSLSRCSKENAEPIWDSLIRETLIEIKVHMELEEEIFYPAHLAASRKVERHHDSMVEHESIKKLIADIENSDPGDGHYYEAMIRALWRMLRVHMLEE
ncbi:MAG TPA: hemerythrin domain-containing protein, partial [Steroidobacteraceae bacterium]